MRFLVGLLLRQYILFFILFLVMTVALALLDIRYGLTCAILGIGLLPIIWILYLSRTMKVKENMRNILPMTVECVPGSHISITRMIPLEADPDDPEAPTEEAVNETIEDRRLTASISGKYVVVKGERLLLLIPGSAISVR